MRYSLPFTCVSIVARRHSCEASSRLCDRTDNRGMRLISSRTVAKQFCDLESGLDLALALAWLEPLPNACKDLHAQDTPEAKQQKVDLFRALWNQGTAHFQARAYAAAQELYKVRVHCVRELASNVCAHGVVLGMA